MSNLRSVDLKLLIIFIQKPLRPKFTLVAINLLCFQLIYNINYMDHKWG